MRECKYKGPLLFLKSLYRMKSWVPSCRCSMLEWIGAVCGFGDFGGYWGMSETFYWFPTQRNRILNILGTQKLSYKPIWIVSVRYDKLGNCFLWLQHLLHWLRLFSWIAATNLYFKPQDFKCLFKTFVIQIESCELTLSTDITLMDMHSWFGSDRWYLDNGQRLLVSIYPSHISELILYSFFRFTIQFWDDVIRFVVTSRYSISRLTMLNQLLVFDSAKWLFAYYVRYFPCD